MQWDWGIVPLKEENKMHERTKYLGSGITKIERIYKTAKKDASFRLAILTADNDTFSRIYASQLEKTIIAGIYYGYLVANYKDDWHTHIA